MIDKKTLEKALDEIIDTLWEYGENMAERDYILFSLQRITDMDNTSRILEKYYGLKMVKDRPGEQSDGT